MEMDFGLDYGYSDVPYDDEPVVKTKKKKKKKKKSKKNKKEPVSYDIETDDMSKFNTKSKKKKDDNTMNQFMSLEAGSSLAGIDLSKIGKYALVSDKGFLGKKPKLVVFFHDRPDSPAVNFELQSDEEAQAIYDKLEKALNKWAADAHSSKVRQLQEEIKVREQEIKVREEETKALMEVFGKFKEMMQLMEDETKTSELVATIKDM